jgi:hypothetical protein
MIIAAKALHHSSLSLCFHETSALILSRDSSQHVGLKHTDDMAAMWVEVEYDNGVLVHVINGSVSIVTAHSSVERFSSW